MAKHQFTKAERFAVWKTHGQECFWCGEPITFKETTIDHVLPESLENAPDELARQIALFGLSADFKINSFHNWVPAHANCNSKKHDVIYRKSQVMLSILETLSRKAPSAQHTHESVLASQKRSSLLAKLEVMIEKAQLSKRELIDLFADSEEQAKEVELIAEDIIKRLSDRWTIVSVEGNLGVATDGNYVGTTWVGKAGPHSSWWCPTCGSYGPWVGARCMNCGHFNDD